MTSFRMSHARRLLSDAELAFVTDGAALSSDALEELRRTLASDEQRRAEVLGDERLFKRVLDLDQAFLRISPRLFFEILLRRSIQEMGRAAHVLEHTGNERVPVFITDRELRSIAQPAVLDYLSAMLASFTKINSHTARVRVRRGVWRKSRYSDLDVPSLLRLASEVDDEQRLAVYKRAADASLLILGMFPDFPATAIRYPGTGALRRRRTRLTTEEYEDVAARSYRAAAEHPSAHAYLAEPMRVLSEHVIDAKRPLSYLAEQYLRLERDELFGTSL